MEEETEKSNTQRVGIFYYNQNSFSVYKTMDHDDKKLMGYYKVNLINGWCDYIKF